MKLEDIPRIRQHNQQLSGASFNAVKEVVAHMGAMQAQDYAMSKWAVGVRLPGLTDKSVEKAIDAGEIIRTHVLRPTWHLVSSKDIHWMLALTAPRIKASMNPRLKELGLSDAIIKKSNKIIVKALQGGHHQTRATLVDLLEKSNIRTDNNRSSHLLLCAELDGIVCSGAHKNNKPTYALLSEWVPKKKSLTRDEALAALANTYFTSHAPATLQDFTWWSGLAPGEAKAALEGVQGHFISEKINGEIYWLHNSFKIPKAVNDELHLLPAYDEFLISYKNRSASLPEEHNKKALSVNGIFYPLIVLNGRVEGLWKRTIKKDVAIIQANTFKTPTKKIKTLIHNAAEKYGDFLEKKIQVVYP
jgi:hypothetical protein